MTLPEHPGDRNPAPSPPRRAAWIVGLSVLLFVAVPVSVRVLSTRSPSAAMRESLRSRNADFAGSQSCRECHPGEAAAHAESGHARTLRTIARTPFPRQLDGIAVADPEQSGVTWRFRDQNGKLAAERLEKGAVERLIVDYAFGSGHHATTFATMMDRGPEHPTMIEHHMTVFAHKDVLDITPGQAKGANPAGMGSFGRFYSTANTLKCFECHSTTTSSGGPDVLDPSTMIANVGCESCHGPARAHVEAARKGLESEQLPMPAGPAHWTVAEELKTCGRCHRLPEMGDPSLIRTDNPVIVRFQPVGLMQSACYRKSRDRLACLTCHDPHTRTSHDQAVYEAACLSCHEGASQTVCAVAAQTGCVGCHMPRREVSRGMMLTDHWIRARPEGATDRRKVGEAPISAGGPIPVVAPGF